MPEEEADGDGAAAEGEAISGKRSHGLEADAWSRGLHALRKACPRALALAREFLWASDAGSAGVHDCDSSRDHSALRSLNAIASGSREQVGPRRQSAGAVGAFGQRTTAVHDGHCFEALGEAASRLLSAVASCRMMYGECRKEKEAR